MGGVLVLRITPRLSTLYSVFWYSVFKVLLRYYKLLLLLLATSSSTIVLATTALDTALLIVLCMSHPIWKYHASRILTARGGQMRRSKIIKIVLIL